MWKTRLKTGRPALPPHTDETNRFDCRTQKEKKQCSIPNSGPGCAARELIKMKVLETSMYNAKEAAAILAEATGADVVQVIGSKFVLFLKKDKDSKFDELPR